MVRKAEGGQPIAHATVEIKGTGDLVDETNASGQYSIPKIPPHTYPQVVASAPGHQATTASNVTIAAGTQSRDFSLHRDWADLASGASLLSFSPPDLSSFGCGPSGAFDLSLASGWGSTAVNPADNTNPSGPKSATISLPQPVDISAFAVDPGATCGDDDSASTRKLKIQTTPGGGAPFSTVGTFTFTGGQDHRLTTIAAPPGLTNVRRVQITMLSNRGGGTAAANFMDLSEFQVYGAP